jgi:hypothetical protein
MIYHPRHIIQKIEKVFKAIDEWSHQPPAYTPPSDLAVSIKKAGERFIDAIVFVICSSEAAIDGMRTHCPRCHERWSEVDYTRSPIHSCAACQLDYSPSYGNVRHYVYNMRLSVIWDIDKKTVSIAQGNMRQPIIIPWIPYDYTQEDIDKYLVIS